MIDSNKSFNNRAKKGVIGASVGNFNKNSCSGFARATTNYSLASIRVSSHADATKAKKAVAAVLLSLFIVLT